MGMRIGVILLVLSLWANSMLAQKTAIDYSEYYDYNEALDVIKIASEETKIIPKLTTKVYFNFNTTPNRYFTIFCFFLKAWLRNALTKVTNVMFCFKTNSRKS